MLIYIYIYLFKYLNTTTEECPEYILNINGCTHMDSGSFWKSREDNNQNVFKGKKTFFQADHSLSKQM